MTNSDTITDNRDSNLEIKDQETNEKIIAEDQNTSEYLLNPKMMMWHMITKNSCHLKLLWRV